MNTLIEKLNSYREWALLAQEQTGKSVLTQFREILELKNMGGQCGVSDYYGFKLYDDNYLLGRGRQDFLGWALQAKFSLALNPRGSVLPAWDKGVFMQLAEPAGLPVAPVLASYHRAKRISSALGIHLKSKHEVAEFLRQPSVYPLFGKPAYSQQGYGSLYLAGYDASTDSVTLLDGQSMRIDEFLIRLDQTIDHRYHKPECGYLFQKSLTLAPEIFKLTQWPAICGVRIICLNGPDGVTPIRAIWKIATPPNHVDNFSLGKNSNLLANVDLESGEISKVIGGFWPNTEVFLKHPTSGQDLRGFQIPCWEKILDACRIGGAVFPLMKIHHWDFAITEQGPLILELNDMGGTSIPQLHGYGLLTEETRCFLKRHAVSQGHPWIKSL